MYTAYFGFTEKPFKLKPDARSVFNSASGQKCYAELVRGLLEQRASIVFSGDSGCGKTTLINKCCTNLADLVRFVQVSNANLSADDILDVLGQELGIGAHDRNLKRRRRRLRASLAAEQQRGRGVVLVVDDAHALNDESLGALLDFAAKPLAGQRLLQLVLVGLPELTGRCQAINPSLLVCTLEGLLGSEIEGFIQHQLRTAGYRGEPLFTTDAIRSVATYAGGIPRRINALCDAALFAASLDERRTVTSQLVAEAVEHSFLKDSAPEIPLTIPPPAPPPAEPLAAAQQNHADDESERLRQQQGMDLASLAADMEQTLERALAVATRSASILARPLLKRVPATSRVGSKVSPASAGVAVTPTVPVQAVVDKPSTSPGVPSGATADDRYMTPARRVSPGFWMVSGASVMLVLVVIFGGWQWRQSTREAALASIPDVATVQKAAIEKLATSKGGAGEDGNLVMGDKSAVDRPVELPRSLDFPPPEARTASFSGLPPDDPDNPFAGRPLQSSHRFLDAQGVHSE